MSPKECTGMKHLETETGCRNLCALHTSVTGKSLVHSQMKKTLNTKQSGVRGQDSLQLLIPRYKVSPHGDKKFSSVSSQGFTLVRN